MRGKLIKEVDFYGLKIDDKIVGLSDDTTNNMLNYPHKLSLKNCEAIELGYDLDELVKNKYPNVDNEDFEYDSEAEMLRDEYKSRGFYEGAKAILEIFGDKKFSEKDMNNAFNEGWYCKSESKLDGKDTFIQSLQQTSWEVEVEMEKMNLDEIREQGKGFLNANTEKPKLDENGCLILKIVK